MANTLTSIRLSETQKTLLCQIIAAPTEELAYEASENGTNIIAAREQLTDLGLMEWEEGSARVTDTGYEVLRDEALVDESNNLTELGNGYAYGEGGQQQSQQPEPQGEEDPFGLDDVMGDEGAPNPQGPEPMTDAGSGEQEAGAAEAQFNSFDLLRTANNAMIIAEQIQRLKKS